MEIISMHSLLQNFKNIIYGQTVFIVGGGPSIKDIDLSLLSDKLVIAVNAAAYDFINPPPTAILWGDMNWSDNNHDFLLNSLCKFKFTSKRYLRKSKIGPFGEYILQLTSGHGIDTNPENIKGNNSGAQALNLCINMGAKRIVLLGFDMKYIGSKSHYHDRHTTPVISDSYKDLFIPCLEKMSEDIITKKIEVDIINCSLVSDLDCFVKKPFDEVIGRTNG